MQPLASVWSCQHLKPTPGGGGKVTSRETFGLANAHQVVACIAYPSDINYDAEATCWSPLKMKRDRICIQSKAFHFFRYFAPLCCTLGGWTGQVGRRRSERRGVALAHSGLGGPQPHRSFFNPFHQSDTFM